MDANWNGTTDGQSFGLQVDAPEVSVPDVEGADRFRVIIKIAQWEVNGPDCRGRRGAEDLSGRTDAQGVDNEEKKECPAKPGKVTRRTASGRFALSSLVHRRRLAGSEQLGDLIQPQMARVLNRRKLRERRGVIRELHGLFWMTNMVLLDSPKGQVPVEGPRERAAMVIRHADGSIEVFDGACGATAGGKLRCQQNYGPVLST